MSIDFERVKAVFHTAVDEHPPEEWDLYLDAACADDPDLRRNVSALLCAHKQSGSILDNPILAPNGDDTITSLSERPGTIIGLYKLLEQIGEGGFGVVFLAEQEQPVKRRVALKIIKPGMDTRQVIARFEAERQALAMMDHPNIAKVLDAGTTGEDRGQRPEVSKDRSALPPTSDLRPPTPSSGLALTPDLRPLTSQAGRPFFVMELVQGVPITEYCDQCNLTTRERLELFITVCHAVQHAHQKGIIHRDIKPTNVLVAIQDGHPAPKIIDFGVAKAIGQRLTEHTLTTAFAQMIGSPLYMSPEQAALSPLGVDTRSDIYSLGVLLYELLTGTTPFDKGRLHAASYDELRRIIREEEPVRPSSRISTLAGDLATTVAEHRRTDPRRLQQTVRGELDWIVMKCLEKDRNRRYETPDSLARDIERYLRDEPVEACPPSTFYRLRKYARRNKVLLAFAALLIAGFVFLAYGYMAIKRERDAKTITAARAKAVDDLFRTMIGSSASGGRVKGPGYTVREMLDDYSAGLGNHLADQPEAEADLRTTIGRTYSALGVYDRAEPHFRRAIELRRMVDGPKHESVATSLGDLGWNLIGQHRYDEAALQLREALQIYHQHGDRDRRLIHAWGMLPLVLASSGRHEEAERMIHQAWDAMHGDGELAPRFPISDDLYCITYYCLGFAYYLDSIGKQQEAADFLHKAASIAKRLPMPHDAPGFLAIARLRMGDEAGYREACAPLLDVPLRLTDDDFNLGCIWVCCLGPHTVDDPTILVKEAEKFAAHNSCRAPYVDLNLLGIAHYRAGNFKRAAQCFAQSIDLYPSDPPPTHGTVVWPQLFLAMAKCQQGDREVARRLLAEAQPATDKYLASQALYWHRRAMTEIFRREAEALIEPKEADEAVEKTERVSPKH